LTNFYIFSKYQALRWGKDCDAMLWSRSCWKTVNAPTLVPDLWTAHGFFSQSGIRTKTPRRRHFDAEAPKP